MLQQDHPEDFVIATGRQYAVREFIEAAAGELGLTLEWRGENKAEQGIVAAVDQERFAAVSAQTAQPCGLRPGDVVVRIDPHYFRPTEVEILLGDATKVARQLGWVPRIGFLEMVAEMVREDLQLALRDAICKEVGFKAFACNE